MALRKPPRNDAQIDLFVPLFGDITSRDGMDLMEFPFFSMSKSKRFEPIIYKNERRGIEITVTGGKPHGIATIWDKDILIWAISQIREAVDRGETPDKKIYFQPYQLLKSVRRGHGRRQYELLEESLIRLRNTVVYVQGISNGVKGLKPFGWLSDFQLQTDISTGEPFGMWYIELSDWVYQSALTNKHILSINEDYFLLLGGRERRLYLLARKHGGFQDIGFPMTMKALYEKMGTNEQYKYWARSIRKIVEENNLPDYYLELWRKGGVEYINFIRRSNLSFEHPEYRSEHLIPELH